MEFQRMQQLVNDWLHRWNRTTTRPYLARGNAVKRTKALP
jgi:hypothetical protein